MFFTGYQTQCSECHKLKEDLETLKRERVAEEPNREANLREANGRHDHVRENDLERAINEERKEKEETKSQLAKNINKLEKELLQHKKTEVNLKRKIERLTNAKKGCLKKIEEPENKNKALEKKNNNLSEIKTEKCETSESDERKAELNRHSTELEHLCNENKSLKTENADFIREITDLKKLIEELETKNKNLLSKIETEECETSDCDNKVKAQLKRRLSSETERPRKDDYSLIIQKENADCLQKIKDLETKNNTLESNIRTKECEIEQLGKEYDRNIKVNADSLQKIKDLEKKIEALERKNERFPKKLKTSDCENCKMLDEEINKYKNAVNSKY